MGDLHFDAARAICLCAGVLVARKRLPIGLSAEFGADRTQPRIVGDGVRGLRDHVQVRVLVSQAKGSARREIVRAGSNPSAEDVL
jgi:hypothetical protein